MRTDYRLQDTQKQDTKRENFTASCFVFCNIASRLYRHCVPVLQELHVPRPAIELMGAEKPANYSLKTWLSRIHAISSAARPMILAQKL